MDRFFYAIKTKKEGYEYAFIEISSNEFLGGEKLVVDTELLFAVKCEDCEEFELKKINIFKLFANKKKDFKCSCGKNKIFLKMSSVNLFSIGIPHKEEIEYHKIDLLKYMKQKNRAITINLGQDCLLLFGEVDSVKKVLKTEKTQIEDLVEELCGYDYFENASIIKKCIKRLKELERQKAIICECGCSKVKFEILTDSININCKKCNNSYQVHAETTEDWKTVEDNDYLVLNSKIFDSRVFWPYY